MELKATYHLDTDAILQSMGEAFVSLDADWCFHFANDKALHLLQKEKHELLGKNMWEVFPEGLGTIYEQQYRKVMEQRVSTSFEAYSPEYHLWLDVHVFPHDGGLSIFFSDVTEKKMADLQRLEEAQRFQLCAQINPSGIFHADNQGKCIFVNDQWLQITGLTKEGAIGCSWVTALTNFGNQEQRSSWQKAVKAGETITETFTYKNNGTQKESLLLMKTIPVFAEEGALIGYVGTVEDISEKVRAHQIVAESEKWFRAVANNAPVLIVSIDVDRKCNYANNTWTVYTGLKADHIISDGWIKAIHEENRDGFVQLFQQAFDKRKSFEGKVKLQHQSNQYRWVSATLQPIFTPDEKFSGYIGTFADIHEQETAHQALEVMVQERTKELTMALQREQELNKVKSWFVSIASHEFRTPLSTILSSAGLIDSYLGLNQTENAKKHIGRIKTAIKHLTDLLGDFLSLEKLEQGKVKPQKALINIESFAKETVNELDTVLKPNQHIRYTFDGQAEVSTDKNIIYNILVNLLSNAIKYSEGDILLKITVNDSLLNLEVTDNGIGIPKEEQAMLFDKYYRASNVGNIKGTGIGLSIVQRYLNLLNGTITLVSEVGQGTTFTLCIPLGN